MKYIDIFKLAKGNFLAATAHSLPDEHFYKFVKFRRDVEKALGKLIKTQEAIMHDCGIEPGTLEKAPVNLQHRYSQANAQLLEEDCGIEVKARIPFACYKGLYDENKTSTFDVFSDIGVEAVIIDNLFSIEENV